MKTCGRCRKWSGRGCAIIYSVEPYRALKTCKAGHGTRYHDDQACPDFEEVERDG
jgi:hypothetical protein